MMLDRNHDTKWESSWESMKKGDPELSRKNCAGLTDGGGKCRVSQVAGAPWAPKWTWLCYSSGTVNWSVRWDWRVWLESKELQSQVRKAFARQSEEREESCGRFLSKWTTQDTSRVTRDCGSAKLMGDERDRKQGWHLWMLFPTHGYKGWERTRGAVWLTGQKKRSEFSMTT